MTHHILSTASFIVFVSLAAPSYAAEREFKVGLITESRTYEREELVKSGSVGNGVMPIRVSINRVTVALEGEDITGEWKPGPVLRDLMSTSRALARDFPGGTDVQGATSRNQLLLKQPDGSVVKARIVDRVEPEENQEDDDERD
jgi:hypothetical protein